MSTFSTGPAPFGESKPHAVVERAGRWRWRIQIVDGFTACGPDGGWWYRYGRKHAARKAERELRRYVASREPRERFEVWRWGDLTGDVLEKGGHASDRSVATIKVSDLPDGPALPGKENEASHR